MAINTIRIYSDPFNEEGKQTYEEREIGVRADNVEVAIKDGKVVPYKDGNIRKSLTEFLSDSPLFQGLYIKEFSDGVLTFGLLSEKEEN